MKTLTGRRESPNRGGGKKDDGSSTVVLKLDLNCKGCAKKVKHSVCYFEGFASCGVVRVMDDNNLMGKNLVDLDLNIEHLDPPLNSDSRFGSMLNELETTHGRIEERIRELEAVIVRAGQRQLRNAVKISDFSGAHVDRGGKKDGDGSLKESEQFKKQYTSKSEQSDDSVSKSPVPQQNRPTKESRNKNFIEKLENPMKPEHKSSNLNVHNLNFSNRSQYQESFRFQPNWNIRKVV
ncbi:unnamed protein product [Fraxinus pennsylvanica]|uniref:HMA domain-containing protein n=1 Tax=Fraxinus pennsylvanica TaxID=56036 RepID=A0AAD2A6N5_9LAMI|nr:unnamed protein product [Fraxinus pennsylvanica]